MRWNPARSSGSWTVTARRPWPPSIDPAQVGPVVPSALPAGGGTIYLCVADRDGGAVSLIESNYAGFGSGLVDPETGIGYQNRGAFFRLEPGHANSLAPAEADAPHADPRDAAA